MVDERGRARMLGKVGREVQEGREEEKDCVVLELGVTQGRDRLDRSGAVDE